MNEYLKVLHALYMNPRHLQSDFARYNAKIIAEAASRGHITCLLAGIATNKWYLTIKGAETLNEAGWMD